MLVCIQPSLLQEIWIRDQFLERELPTSEKWQLQDSENTYFHWSLFRALCKNISLACHNIFKQQPDIFDIKNIIMKLFYILTINFQKCSKGTGAERKDAQLW